MSRPTILCPIDFSGPSRAALRFAATIAEHFYGGVIVMTVDDPLLAAAAETAYGAETYGNKSRQELERFVDETFRRRPPQIAELAFEVSTGKPAPEILRVAAARDVDLIVMSTHGYRGLRRAFFGSTTERLLRETHVPVLVTPAGDPGPADLEDLARGSGSILAPVDLTAFSGRQLAIASGVARALGRPLTVVHVIEPLIGRTEGEEIAQALHGDRTRRAREELHTLAAAVDATPAVVLTEGDPAAEIVRIAAEGTAAIVMGLHDSAALGPRMGSVTYRVLCQTGVPVLALPPFIGDAKHRPDVFTREQSRQEARR